MRAAAVPVPSLRFGWNRQRREGLQMTSAAVNVLYTAEATATGGRAGPAASADRPPDAGPSMAQEGRGGAQRRVRRGQPPGRAGRAVGRLEPDDHDVPLDALDPARSVLLVDHVGARVPAARRLLLGRRRGAVVATRARRVEQVLLGE